MNQPLCHLYTPGSAAPFEPAHERFEQIAMVNPGAAVFHHEHGALTYGELDNQADGLACRLQRQGLGPGQFCALHLAPSCALLKAMLAVLKASAAFLVLDPAGVPASHRALVRLFDTRLVLSRQEYPDCAADSGSTVLQLGEDIGDEPWDWPQQYPVRAGTTACVVPDRPQHGGSGALAVLTHAELAALCDAGPQPGGLRTVADLWRALAHGLPVSLPH
jgi:acyl-CoA synthetase (AMP-forming)/AMP-acid ligase II